MSNLLYMDESNGNGVYAAKPNNCLSVTTTNLNSHNVNINVNDIMNASSTAAIAAANAVTTIPTSVSSEDLSQSLSEYTDADESISAPTEFLAEFLSAVMLKDYKKALKYCKLILQYEPNNTTAKEFYPLILNKLQDSSGSDENDNKSPSPEFQLSYSQPDPDNKVATVEEPLSRMDSGADEFGVSEDNSSGEPNSNYSNLSSSRSISPDESFSESLDEERGIIEMPDLNDEDDLENEEQDANSSSEDELPIDEPHDLLYEVAGADCGHASQSSSGGEGRSRSDNTTNSYSSLLLEEEDDIVATNLHLTKNLRVHDMDVANGNIIPSASCSDSESPTEPLTQRLAAILRSSCGVNDSV